MTELQVTVDDYHDQLHRSKVKSGGPGDNNYRQMMIEKEVEYSKLLDDFQVFRTPSSTDKMVATD